MSRNWEIRGYRIRYFGIEESAADTVRSLNKWLKKNRHLEIESIEVSGTFSVASLKDEWDAHVIYAGTPVDED